MENKIDFNLTDEEKTKINEAFTTIWDVLHPKVVNLHNQNSIVSENDDRFYEK